MTKPKKAVFLSILTALLIMLVSACSFAVKEKTENSDEWIIRSYKNNVVLMKNNEIVEVFGDIAIDDLPKEDQKHLEKGIPFVSKEEALIALEDYDG